MPEGDTVFRTCHRLHEVLAGHRLTRGELRHPRLSTHDLTDSLVREIAPRGKHLLLRLDDGTTLHHHLRMDGSWHLYRPGERWRRPAHQARAVLATGTRVAVGFNLHDMRLLPTVEEPSLLDHLGPDVLSPDWDDVMAAEAVRRASADPDRAIGEVLLDQTVLAGIGNLYRNEICFLLGHRPATAVSEVDVERAVRLGHDLLYRNRWHPEQATTSDPRPGARHWVYGRRTCLRCGTAVHRTTTRDAVEDRVTYHCPRCQR